MVNATGQTLWQSISRTLSGEFTPGPSFDLQNSTYHVDKSARPGTIPGIIDVRVSTPSGIISVLATPEQAATFYAGVNNWINSGQALADVVNTGVSGFASVISGPLSRGKTIAETIARNGISLLGIGADAVVTPATNSRTELLDLFGIDSNKYAPEIGEKISVPVQDDWISDKIKSLEVEILGDQSSLINAEIDIASINQDWTQFAGATNSKASDITVNVDLSFNEAALFSASTAPITLSPDIEAMIVEAEQIDIWLDQDGQYFGPIDDYSSADTIDGLSESHKASIAQSFGRSSFSDMSAHEQSVALAAVEGRGQIGYMYGNVAGFGVAAGYLDTIASSEAADAAAHSDKLGSASYYSSTGSWLGHAGGSPNSPAAQAAAAAALGVGTSGLSVSQGPPGPTDKELDEIFDEGWNDSGDTGGKPIILDLDGDGVEMVELEDSTAFFDINGDGYRNHMGWAIIFTIIFTCADDGFLVYDREPDSEITDWFELSFLEYDDEARTDLEGLRAFDSNLDGVLDSNDNEWLDFKVWQDADQDGEVDSGELRTLASEGITELDLTDSIEIAEDVPDYLVENATVRDNLIIDSNIVFATGNFSMNTTTDNLYADAALASSAFGFKETEDDGYIFGSQEEGYTRQLSTTGSESWGMYIKLEDEGLSGIFGAQGGDWFVAANDNYNGVALPSNGRSTNPRAGHRIPAPDGSLHTPILSLYHPKVDSILGCFKVGVNDDERERFKVCG